MDFPSIVRYLTCTEPSVGFPGGSEVKASACNVGDLGSIPGLQRFPGEGNGNPPQYSCLENPVDGGAWWTTIHGVAKSRTRLNDRFHFQALNGEGNCTPLQYSCWKIPWTEEPGRLQSMGLRRVGQD